MKEYEIITVVDSNDADYQTTINIITEEDLNKIKPLIEAIKKNSLENKNTRNFHNYPYGEYCPRLDLGELTKEQLYPNVEQETFEILEEYLQYGEYGFHTIKSIEIGPINIRTKLL